MLPQAGTFYETFAAYRRPNSTVFFVRPNDDNFLDEDRGGDNFITVMNSSDDELEKNYIALLLLIIPVLTIFGNALVLISVFREKSLQTTTNFLIASLAVSDFLVAFCVMPFAVYVVVSSLH